MREPTGTSVDCPVCGEGFDPTAAGGWCTNSDCGEWQYEGEGVPDPAPADRDADDADVASVDAATEETATAAADEDSEKLDDGEESAATGTETEADGIPDEDDAGSGKTTAEQSDDEADAGATDAAATAEVSCPECDTDLDADADFCANCGADLAAIREEDADGAGDELAGCPACDADVDPDDAFCSNCGEDLDDHRGTADLSACPSCGSDVDGTDSFCVDCGEDLDAHRDGSTGGGDSPDSTGAPTDEAATDEAGSAAPADLVLVSRGHTVDVEPGEPVGRELRRIVTETGGEEDQAVRIHREHVRFDREDGGFVLEDLGANPTRLNDESLSAGDRRPVAPGDELSLSGVLTLEVREA